MGKKTKKGKDRLDKYYHLAKDQGFRARSAFKLIQLAKKSDFLSKARVCIDLCAAPGGWSQVAQRNMPSGSLILAIDLVPIKPMPGVTCIQSDITTDKCRSILKKQLQGAPADIVLHDGAPNVGTSWAKDAYSQAELVLHSLKLACEHLRSGGAFVTKVFRSADYNSLLWVFNQLFDKVEATKPTASRNVSAEIFVLCMKFKAGKIDPRFFDPKWVFMETVDPIAEAGVTDKKPSATLKDYLKSQGKRHRGGYEPGDDHKLIGAEEFIKSDNPAAVLVTHHQINLEAPGSESLKDHSLTTDEIRELCADLKVIGKKDLSKLLKWRMKIMREREKAERAAAKKSQAGHSSGTVDGADPEASAAANAASAVAKDVDDAIADLLDEDAGASKGGGAAVSGDEADVAEEELEKELAEQIDKRRRDEKREAKKTMERQKKREFRKKMSLITSKEAQDQPELFKSSKQSVKALEDQDKYIDPRALDSGQEDSSDDGNPCESEPDDGLDRVARLEVDMAVYNELEKLRKEDKFRTSMQRIRKKKKETRRQRVMAAWAGEMNEFSQALEQRVGEEHALRDAADADADDDGDSSVDLEALREFQEFQASQQRALEEGDDGERGPDGDALRALADGPPPEEAPGAEGGGSAKADRGSGGRRSAAASEGAIVPVDVAGEEILRAEHRAVRWFSQDIFQSVGSGDGKLRGLYDHSSEEEEGGSGDEVEEVDESLLPKLPLSDKQKRRLKRRREKERAVSRGKKPKKGEEEDSKPLEVTPLEPPRPIVPTEREKSKFEKPSDPRELAETLALGSVLVESKKSRMELIDAAYNRWAFEKDDSLPDWFREEEDRFNRPELPISKELMAQFRAKLREINARPIRKVAQARARKKRRLQKRLEKLRTTAMSLVDSPDMSEAAKARQMKKAVNKMAKDDRRKVTVVAMTKGGGGNRGRLEKGKTPRGAKVKVVDRRLKADRRGEKRANKRNPQREKMKARKVAKMKTRTNGKKFIGSGRKKKKHGDAKD